MSSPVLVTGASGTIGRSVAAELESRGSPLRRASRHASGPDTVRFDFTDASTWDEAFTGVETMLVVRPPQLGNVRRDLLPALQRARELGVRRMVLLSVQHADRLPVPHARIEQWLRGSGVEWTFVRPAYFDQNLSGVFAADIRERGELVVPTGNARMAFVDGVDVAAVIVAALSDPEAHRGRIWTPTSAEAPTWDEVAETLSAELGRTVRHRRVGLLGSVRHLRRDLGMDLPEALVTTMIHASARLGSSAQLTDDVSTVVGRPPISLGEFVHRERAAWG